jgi:hypothetical protein
MDLNQPKKPSYSDSSGAERRKNERFSIETPVQWRLKGEKSAIWADEALLDISISGAAFSATEPLAAGTLVSLRISPPQGATDDPNHRPVLIVGTVRNSAHMGEGRYRNGVEFNHMYFLFAEWARKLRS